MAAKSSLSPGSPEWPRELGAGVRQKRKLLGLTQAQLADLAQCGPDFLFPASQGEGAQWVK